MTSKKILVISKGFYPEAGGLEKYSEKVAAAYQKAGHKTTVLTACSEERKTFTHEGVSVFNVGTGSQYFIMLKMLIKLIQLRLSNKYTFVHATSWKVALPAFMVGLRKRVFVSVHGTEIFIHSGLTNKIMLKVFFYCSGIAVVSKPILEKARKAYPGFFQKNAKVVWNGISFPELSEEPSLIEREAKTIFCMCRLVERKNVVRAIQAVSQVYNEGVECVFYIAGSGDQKQNVEDQIMKSDASSYIKYLGRITDQEAIELYRKSTIFLHPQTLASNGHDIEGFGISIADAMSFGCVPIVGVDGGPSDFIENGVNGLVVDGMSVDEIVMALRVLLTDKGKCGEMAATAQKFSFEKLTWDYHAKEILSLVNSLH